MIKFMSGELTGGVTSFLIDHRSKNGFVMSKLVAMAGAF